MTRFDPRFRAVAETLRAHSANAEQQPAGAVVPRAAVALLLRSVSTGGAPELLLIRRAERAGDPWSGHVALPGGRADAGDADGRATAARETREEVGIDVESQGRWLGMLDALHPRGSAPELLVEPHVFAVATNAAATPNHEVTAALWVPLRELADPAAAAEYLYHAAGGEPVRFPALRGRGEVIWGMTYRVLTQFLERCGAELLASSVERRTPAWGLTR